MTTRTKRPHFIPATYLRAWADDDDQVAVRRRDNEKAYKPNVINVAVKAGLYGAGSVGQSREEIFGKLEETWPTLREALITHGGRVDAETRSQVSLFAATQLIRTDEHLTRAGFARSFAEFSARRPVSKDDIRTFLAERWLMFPPSEREVEGAWTIAHVILGKGELPSGDQLVSMQLGIAARELAPRLTKYHWVVENCRKPILLTSDRPVMSWRRRSLRDEYEGIGIETAEEIRMPITPHDLLIIRPNGIDGGIERVQPRRFQRVNGDVVSQCYEFIVGMTKSIHKLEELQIAAHRPVLRFDVGPGTRVMPDGREEPMGDIVHTWVPIRAD